MIGDNIINKMDKESIIDKKKSRTGFSTRIICIIVFSFLIYGAVIAVIGFCIFREFFNSDHYALVFYTGSILFAAIIFAALLSFLSSRYVKKQLSGPVEEISAEAVRFVKEYKVDKPLGNISRIDELSALAGAIDMMEIKMTDYIDELTAATAEKEKIRTEIDLAGKIQRSQIPSTFPAFPDRNEFDIYGYMMPARMIGGDFYNYMLIDDDHLAMWIGDVSGKGIPAALFMMSTNLMLSTRVRFKGSPAQILADVNNRICENNNAGMFVTVWLGILELSTGRLTAANGGHEFPIIYRNDCFERCFAV